MPAKLRYFWGIVFLLPLMPHPLLADTDGVPLVSIELKKQVYFISPEDEDLILPPGYYTVEAASDGLQLIEGLTPEQAGEAFLLQARTRASREQGEEARAISMSIDEDRHYLALRLPTGKTLESIGSYSGVRSRGKSVHDFFEEATRNVEEIMRNRPISPEEAELIARRDRLLNAREALRDRRKKLEEEKRIKKLEEQILERWKGECATRHPNNAHNHNNCCIKKYNSCLRVGKKHYTGSARRGFQQSCQAQNRACWVKTKGNEEWMKNYCSSKKNLKKLRTSSKEMCCTKMHDRCKRAAYSVPQKRREISVANCSVAWSLCGEE